MTGTRFSPSVIYSGAALPMARSRPDDFVEHYFSGPDDGTQVVDIMVAAGPFTTTGDLSYDPLNDLLDVVRRDCPDVLIMIGPFVDEDHPMIKAADCDVTYEELFQQVLSQAQEAITESKATAELIVIPSLRDVHHDRVYPQPPLQAASEHDRVHMFANPATIKIKEMTIGINAEDILFDLTSQETSRGQGGDRMGRLANHLLDQRSYYPMFPPSPAINIAYEQIEKAALPITPDILLLPSQMRYFAKNINGCVVVNPGKLTKHSNGGTFSRIAVHAPRRVDVPEGSKPIAHGIAGRAVVQVVRV